MKKMILSFLVGQGLLLDFLLVLACVGYRIVIEAPQWYVDFLSRWFVILPVK